MKTDSNVFYESGAVSPSRDKAGVPGSLRESTGHFNYDFPIQGDSAFLFLI